MMGDKGRFRPKLGRIRSAGGARAKSYLSRVLRAVAGAGGFAHKGRRGFTGTRIGRGAGYVARLVAGGGRGPAYRRVVIKSRIVRLGAGRQGLSAARAHLRYLERDGVTREGERGELYSAREVGIDGKAFLERAEGDRHQFRFIVSAEDALELEELKPFVRDLMARMEDDLGTRLDWVAVDHFNTAHPHTHIILRGKDDQGKDLVIARDYLSRGMRRRASELVTLELGPASVREHLLRRTREVQADRFTGIDRELAREQDRLGHVRPGIESDPHRGATRIARLRVLEARGLVAEEAPGRWQLAPEMEATLRRMGERGDIIKTLHRAMREAGIEEGLQAIGTGWQVYDAGAPGTPKITGNVIDRGLHDELSEQPYIVIDTIGGQATYVVLSEGFDLEEVPMGAVVEVAPARAAVREVDRTIMAVAREMGGVYTEGAHARLMPDVPEDSLQAHKRRLEALRRQGHVERMADGRWRVPDDLVRRLERDARIRRRPALVRTLSYLSLEAQVTAGGATWLDRMLVTGEAPGGSRFAERAQLAMEKRQVWLEGQGLARREAGGLRYRRQLLSYLYKQELKSVADRLQEGTGKSYAPLREGERVSGSYKGPVRLAGAKLALIEGGQSFTLVPWRPVLERRRGQAVAGIMRGGRISYDLGRKRGIGIGV
ncbi:MULTISPECIES: DUF3363 domain-containing protein [Kordiimonas]|jgi:type IV secretory pathway VirD2 relaxase|uniref:DUF3363 domain-containing protein n=1 Tax=Kordiimonas TaxID=288021 RepID=UPI00257ABCA9|nr:DUF3363 domain-containing protein [Kordiimonas sp. UBA4487]